MKYSLILKSFLLSIVNLMIVVCAEQEYAPIIATKSGRVRGVVRQLDDGRKVNLYDGIPYAEPPIGDLRFDKPVPINSWSDVYNATQYRYNCHQIKNLTGFSLPKQAEVSENCLYLSVWQPNTPAANARSVMIWFYGGGFTSGTIFTFIYDARYIAALGDVIVVTVNYRLGPFGFLYAGTNNTQGNAGLYDQILSIKWVKNNIAAFGGDPDTITIFGESAGSMSVGALVLSPLTHGLFKRAIMQSGAPNSYYGSGSLPSALIKTKSLAKKLNCSVDPIEDMVNCMREKDADFIQSLVEHAVENGEVFAPVYGTELMPTKPYDALKAGKFNQNLDLLFGTVNNEGSAFAEGLFASILNPHINETNITVSLANSTIQFMFLVFKESNGKDVANFYLKGLTNDDQYELRRAIEYSFGDYHLVCPTVLFGSSYAQFNATNKAYSYRFSHVPAIAGNYMCGKGDKWMDMCHGDDLVLLFGLPIKLRGIAFTEDDYKLSVDTINVWTTFAKTGVPPKLNNAEWVEAIDRNSATPSVRVMDLNASNYTIIEGLYRNNCDTFWKSHFDKS